MAHLNLREALKTGRLPDFIAQAEADALAAEASDFDDLAERFITAPPPEGQTSRSPARDGSRGTQTR